MSADGRISLLPSTALFDAHRPHLASYSYTQHVPPSSQSRPTSPLSASSTTSSTSSTPSLSSYASNDSVSSASSADSNTAVTSHMHDAAGMTQILKHDGQHTPLGAHRHSHTHTDTYKLVGRYPGLVPSV